MSCVLFPLRTHEPSERRETMTTLENRPNTALLVVDVQNGVEGRTRATQSWRTSAAWSRRRGKNRRDAGQGRPHDGGSDGRGAPPPDQVIAHTNLYWTYEEAPGRTAGTVETKAVDFGGAS
jgi:hypothetical protein